MFRNKIRKLEIRKDLQPYFAVTESKDSGTKGFIECLHENCQERQAKPRAYNAKQGWSSHILHLETQHGINKESLSGNTKGNESIISFIAKRQKLGKFSNADSYKSSDFKQVQYITNLMDLVCIAGVPLSIVDHPVFMKFSRDLDKSIRLPSRTTVARRICSESRRIVKINASRIKNVPDSSLHFSFDLWSTRNHSNVMGIKVHFIDDKWKLATFCLGVLEFDQKKSGSEIRKAFLNDLSTRYKIKPEQVGFVMSDNARENISAFGSNNIFVDDILLDDEEAVSNDEWETIDWIDCRDYTSDDIDSITVPIPFDEEDAVIEEASNWASKTIIRLGCVNHALQLVIKNCLNKNSTCKEIQDQLDHIGSFFNRSNNWHSKLVKKTQKGLIKMGDTRWNGFLLSLRRVLETGFITNLNSVLEEAHSVSGRANKVPELISPERESQMVELSQLLSPFLNLTNELQIEGITSSLVILGIITLYKQVAAVECKTQCMKELKSSLCFAITERFGAKEQMEYSGRGARKNLLRVFDDTAYLLATVLDPRWKLAPFEIPLPEAYHLNKYVPTKEKVKKLLLQEYRKEVGTSFPESVNEVSGTSESTEMDFISSFIPNQNPAAPSELAFENEVEAYLAETRCSRNSDPLEYYRLMSEKNKFPTICRLARKYLAFPATSSSIERIFSITGSLNRARRATLATKTMESFLLYREFRRDQLNI